MKAVTLEVSAEVVRALGVPEAQAEAELRNEFAVFLVMEGLLSRAKARLLTTLERVEFEDLLARRKVAWEGSAEDAIKDAAAAQVKLGLERL